MNIDDVKRLTGIATNEVKMNQAKAVVESFIGRLESEIEGKDLEWFIRMVCWQTVYMTENDVFTTANVESIRQDDSTVKFNKNFSVSPLVITATRHLSWKVAVGQVQMNPWITGRSVPEWYLW